MNTARNTWVPGLSPRPWYNTLWYNTVKSTKTNYTYYFPMKQEYHGKNIDAYVLGLKGNKVPMFVEAWITAYPIPLKRVELVLE